MLSLYQERFPGNQWKPLQPIALVSRTGDLVKIYYEDGTFRLVPYIQDLLEQRIGRELMRHEFAWVRGCPIEVSSDDVVLMVCHPDWPKVDDVPQIAKPFIEPKWIDIETDHRDGRKTIRMNYSDGTKYRTTHARYLFSKTIQRNLIESEQVDHIDEINTHDNIDNLQILSPLKNVEKSNNHRYPDGPTVLTAPCGYCGKEVQREAKRMNYELKINQQGVFCDDRCKGRSNMKLRYPKGREMVDCSCLNCDRLFTKPKAVEAARIRREATGPFCSPVCSYSYRRKAA